MAAGDGWHYIAQRFDGTTGDFGAFLDLDVPLQGVSIDEVLSGHSGMNGTITPEYPRLKGADGQPILLEGGTAIWAESPDGEIRGGGIVTRSSFNESGAWAVECTDVSSIAVGLPYTDGMFFVNVDPIDVFRYIWKWIQGQRGSNMGITIDGATSPIRLGGDLIQRVEFDLEPDPSTAPPPADNAPAPPPAEDLEPAPPVVAPPRYNSNALWRDAAVKALSANGWRPNVVDAALVKWLNKDDLQAAGKWTPLTEKERTIRDRSIEKVGWPPNPPNPGARDLAQIGIINVQPTVEPPVGGAIIDPPPSVDPVPTTEPAPPGPTYEYDPYKLTWYETLDLDAELSKLASDTPFDWHLTHRWQGDEIRHHIRVGYPRLGRRRADLRFVVGENIHTAPEVTRDYADYANEVIVLGAGEGSTMIRGTAFRPLDGRIRKVVVVSDPSIKTEADAIRRAQSELAMRSTLESVTTIVVENHPHAPIGAVDLGDEILVEGDIGWLDFSLWCRVIGRTMEPDNGERQTLTILRTDRIG